MRLFTSNLRPQPRRVAPALWSLALLAALVLALAPFAAAAKNTDDGPSAVLSEKEREELLAMLDETATRLAGLIEGTTDEQWAWKPAPERWSVGECAEHILLSEAALLEAARNALAKPPVDDWAERTKGKEQLLRQVMPNRQPGGAGGASAPQEIRPSGDLSRRETLERFAAQRQEVVQFVEQLSAPVRAHIEPHPFPIFGDLSAYEWVLYIPLHTIRHTRQLLEVQETEGYPGGE